MAKFVKICAVFLKSFLLEHVEDESQKEQLKGRRYVCRCILTDVYVSHHTGDVQCSVPLQNPVNLSFEPHDGSVHSVECSPYHRNLFLTCASDGTARIYSMLQASWSVGMMMMMMILNDGEDNEYLIMASRFRHKRNNTSSLISPMKG